ncbi:hypothetical protein DERP_006726 [Dermatophagoides pteronyssinus]|uniref:Uncharacterized protein n=1 Tax=Dermatophagoides pteronyssinus TaxID=6956 RepID=A0ABQ8IRU0_DERPT|nr:hypothetical protein DERP_006726 [Dermatophagoides pteronyssinus]
MFDRRTTTTTTITKEKNKNKNKSTSSAIIVMIIESYCKCLNITFFEQLENLLMIQNFLLFLPLIFRSLKSRIVDPLDSCLIEVVVLIGCKLDELVVEFGVQLGGNGIVDPLLFVFDDDDVINDPGKRPGVDDVPVIDKPLGFNDPVDNANKPALTTYTT